MHTKENNSAPRQIISHEGTAAGAIPYCSLVGGLLELGYTVKNLQFFGHIM